MATSQGKGKLNSDHLWTWRGIGSFRLFLPKTHFMSSTSWPKQVIGLVFFFLLKDFMNFIVFVNVHDNNPLNFVWKFYFNILIDSFWVSCFLNFFFLVGGHYFLCLYMQLLLYSYMICTRKLYFSFHFILNLYYSHKILYKIFGQIKSFVIFWYVLVYVTKADQNMDSTCYVC